VLYPIVVNNIKREKILVNYYILLDLLDTFTRDIRYSIRPYNSIKVKGS